MNTVGWKTELINEEKDLQSKNSHKKISLEREPMTKVA